MQLFVSMWVVHMLSQVLVLADYQISRLQANYNISGIALRENCHVQQCKSQLPFKLLYDVMQATAGGGPG